MEAESPTDIVVCPIPHDAALAAGGPIPLDRLRADTVTALATLVTAVRRLLAD